MAKEEKTKKRILEAAKEIFYKKGISGARMSEIAEAANINKAMLHYYFKTKQDLFDNIFLEAFSKIFPQLLAIIGKDIPLEDKIREISAFYNETLTQNPHLPIFVLSAIQQDAERFTQKVIIDNPVQPAAVIGKFMQQIAEAVGKGEMKPIDPRHLMLNLVSMSVFPFMMKPLLTSLFGIKDADFLGFMSERKTAVPEFILDSISLKKDS